MKNAEKPLEEYNLTRLLQTIVHCARMHQRSLNFFFSLTINAIMAILTNTAVATYYSQCRGWHSIHFAIKIKIHFAPSVWDTKAGRMCTHKMNAMQEKKIHNYLEDNIAEYTQTQRRSKRGTECWPLNMPRRPTFDVMLVTSKWRRMHEACTLMKIIKGTLKAN